ncbi:MAG: cupin domain-containing protein [Actinomycetota bacterium]
MVRLYPIDIARMGWADVADGGSVREKVLALDPETGSVTRLLRIEAGGTLPGGKLDRWEETFVLEGSYSQGVDQFAEGSFTCQPPDTDVEPRASSGGCTLIQMRDLDGALDKDAVRLSRDQVEAMPWLPTAAGITGHGEKILTQGPSGSLTRLLLFDPGADTTIPDDHDHNEEVLILKGGCKNGEEFHPAGTYTFNPPHTVHGPFLVDEPLMCFEVKNIP